MWLDPTSGIILKIKKRSFEFKDENEIGNCGGIVSIYSDFE